MSSTCFETKVSSSGRRLYVQVWYSVFYMHLYKQFCRQQWRTEGGWGFQPPPEIPKALQNHIKQNPMCENC